MINGKWLYTISLTLLNILKNQSGYLTSQEKNATWMPNSKYSLSKLEHLWYRFHPKPVSAIIFNSSKKEKKKPKYSLLNRNKEKKIKGSRKINENFLVSKPWHSATL